MNLNEPKKRYAQEACQHIAAEIESLRCHVHLIMDFYMGVKTLNESYRIRTEVDDKRLFWTLGQSRERIKKLQKQRDDLMKNLPEQPL